MKLLRSTMMIAMLLSCAAYAFAQQPVCTLKQQPELNGFRIGMLKEDIKDMLADASMFESKWSAVNKIGAQAIQIFGSELKDEYAEGIDSINLTFVDKKLAVIKATYNGSTWMGAQDFFKQTSNKLGLPQVSAANSSSSRGNEKYKVECGGLTAVMAYSFGVSPNVTIYDTAQQQLVEERNRQNPDGEVKEINITPPRAPRTRPPGRPR